MPLNKVVVGAPSATAVPACVFACVGKQLSAETLELLELLDDVLVELAELVLLEELTELTLLEELTELVELDVLEVTDEELTELTLLEELVELELMDEELFDETLLLEAPLAVAVVGSAEPPLHAETNKARLPNRLTSRKRIRVFMIPLPRGSSIANKMFGLKIRYVTI